MKSMDRGVDAANQLISSMFLVLVPAILECLVVVVCKYVWMYSMYVCIHVAVRVYLCDNKCESISLLYFIVHIFFVVISYSYMCVCMYVGVFLHHVQAVASRGHRVNRNQSVCNSDHSHHEEKEEVQVCGTSLICICYCTVLYCVCMYVCRSV